MKKLVFTLSSSIAYLVTATHAFALNLCDPNNQQFSKLCNISTGNTDSLIASAINFIFVVAIIVALFYLIWGGIKWLLSQGDKAGVEGAKQHIIAALVGLVVIFLSYFILNIVLHFFGLSLANISFPTLP